MKFKKTTNHPELFRLQRLMTLLLILVLLIPLKAFSYAFVMSYKKLDSLKIDMRLITILEEDTHFEEKTILLYPRQEGKWSNIPYLLNLEEAKPLYQLLNDEINHQTNKSIYKFRAHIYFNQLGECYFNLQPMDSSEKYKICLTQNELHDFLSYLKDIPQEFTRIENIIVNNILNKN